MSIPKIASALGYIDEELICRAVDFSPDYRKSFRFSWKYAVALAACFCVAVIIAISPNSRLQENTGVDVEPCVHLSLQEAQSDPVFGQYVPTVIAEGFELESTVNVYDEKVMQAVFVNESENKTLTVEIRAKNRDENITTNTIMYWSESTQPESSYINVDCVEYIITFSSNGDLKKIDGFEEMLYSAKFFNTLSKSYISAIRTIKGTENLSWDDFDQFSYEDIGSGRYVYKYNLSDGASLFMAGDSLDNPPTSIYIIEKDGTETIIK